MPKAILWQKTGAGLVAVDATNPLPVQLTGTPLVGILGIPQVGEVDHVQRQITPVPQGAFTATLQGSFTNDVGRGVALVVNVVSGTTPLITPSIEWTDGLSGTWFTLVTGAQITAPGKQTIIVHPNAPATVFDTKFACALPRNCRVNLAWGNANLITVAVAGCLLL